MACTMYLYVTGESTTYLWRIAKAKLLAVCETNTFPNYKLP